MPKTPIITVTLPTGEVIKRATWRTYSHAVVLSKPGKKPTALAWCGTPALAQKQFTYWTGAKRINWKAEWARGGGWQVAMLPVDGTGNTALSPIFLAPVAAGEDEELSLPDPEVL